MGVLELLQTGFAVVFEPSMFLLMVVAVMLGTIFGALPGVSATMAVALGVPFTYSMSPVKGIAFLVAIYCASITGGSITAILFKIPGTPSSAPTTIEGYALAQQGRAGYAMGVSLAASAMGGMFSALAMLLLSPQLTKAALSFGPSELFAVTFLGLSILTSLDSDNMNRCIISGLLGLFLSCVGIDPLLGIPRLTFGSSILTSGIEMIPVMIGIFAVTEVLKQTEKSTFLKAEDGIDGGKVKTEFPKLKEYWALKWNILRHSFIGTIVGILPGAGATIASFLSYSSEMKMCKHPELVGKGSVELLCASETSNNAATGGAMVPLLTMGIPGGSAAAIMMSALVLKGVQMGPLLLVNQPEFLAATFSSMFVANILMVFAAMLVARVFAKILAVPYSVLGPIIVMLATIGSYSTKNAIVDVQLMAIAGVVGFLFKACHFDATALILGLVLGPLCETNLRRAVTIANGDSIFEKILGLLQRPITGFLLLVCVVMLLYPVIKPMLSKKKESQPTSQN